MASAGKDNRTSAAATAKVSCLADDLAELMRALRTLVGGYHPEQHYMRGPGPAWHAKNDQAADAELHEPGVAALARVKV